MLSWQVRLLELYFRLQHAFAPKRGEVDVDKERVELDKKGAIFKLPKGVKSVKELAGGVPAEWLIPPGVSNGRVVLYLHGGYYICGSPNSHRSLAANIAIASKARALVIDYRLAPEHPHPAAVEDAVAAYKWLINGRVDPKHLAVAGDSAGGGLAIALLVSLRDRNIPLPAACVCLSPWTDLAFTGETWQSKAKVDLIIYDYKGLAFAKIYLGGLDPKTPLASPLYADLKRLPPLLVQVGTDEVLLSDSTRLVDNAKQAGVNAVIDEWEKMQHVWQFAASFIPEGRRAIERIGEFIDRYCGRT
ncbi:MAG: alpha/beta hydrolase [Chloroflexi bacterium]|nr:alpha/beta hydrolase [Chloroflexota bacterium]